MAYTSVSNSAIITKVNTTTSSFSASEKIGKAGAAQSAPFRKDIPATAKAADGVAVSITTSDRREL